MKPSHGKILKNFALALAMTSYCSHTLAANQFEGMIKGMVDNVADGIVTGVSSVFSAGIGRKIPDGGNASANNNFSDKVLTTSEAVKKFKEYYLHTKGQKCDGEVRTVSGVEVMTWKQARKMMAQDINSPDPSGFKDGAVKYAFINHYGNTTEPMGFPIVPSATSKDFSSLIGRKKCEIYED